MFRRIALAAATVFALGLAQPGPAAAAPITFVGDLTDGLVHNGSPANYLDYEVPALWSNGNLWTLSVNAGDTVTVTALRLSDFDPVVAVWNGTESDTSAYFDAFTNSANTTWIGYGDDQLPPNIPNGFGCCGDPQFTFTAATTGVYTVGVFALGGQQGVDHFYSVVATGATGTVQVAVPAPGAVAIFGLGLAAIGFMRRRRAA